MVESETSEGCVHLILPVGCGDATQSLSALASLVLVLVWSVRVGWQTDMCGRFAFREAMPFQLFAKPNGSDARQTVFDSSISCLLVRRLACILFDISCGNPRLQALHLWCWAANIV